MLHELLWVRSFGFAAGFFKAWSVPRFTLLNPIEHDSHDKPMPTKDVVFEHRTEGASAQQIRVGF